MYGYVHSYIPFNWTVAALYNVTLWIFTSYLNLSLCPEKKYVHTSVERGRQRIQSNYRKLGCLKLKTENKTL